MSQTLMCQKEKEASRHFSKCQRQYHPYQSSFYMQPAKQDGKGVQYFRQSQCNAAHKNPCTHSKKHQKYTAKRKRHFCKNGPYAAGNGSQYNHIFKKYRPRCPVPFSKQSGNHAYNKDKRKGASRNSCPKHQPQHSQKQMINPHRYHAPFCLRFR